jgi:hypothetical protein
LIALIVPVYADRSPGPNPKRIAGVDAYYRSPPKLSEINALARRRAQEAAAASKERPMRRIGRLLLVMVVTATATAGLIFLHYYNELDRARAAAENAGVIVSTLAGPIEYAKKGTGPPLLSIHGAGGGYDQGLALAADLVGDGFRVIAPSRFGYLRTPVPRDASPAAQRCHRGLLATAFRLFLEKGWTG